MRYIAWSAKFSCNAMKICFIGASDRLKVDNYL